MSEGTRGSGGPGVRPPHPATVEPRAPHPATVVQGKVLPPHPAAVVKATAPHPATVAQPKPAIGGKAERPPHLATVVQARAPHRAAGVSGAGGQPGWGQLTAV